MLELRCKKKAPPEGMGRRSSRDIQRIGSQRCLRLGALCGRSKPARCRKAPDLIQVCLQGDDVADSVAVSLTHLLRAKHQLLLAKLKGEKA